MTILILLAFFNVSLFSYQPPHQLPAYYVHTSTGGLVPVVTIPPVPTPYYPSTAPASFTFHMGNSNMNSLEAGQQAGQQQGQDHQTGQNTENQPSNNATQQQESIAIPTNALSNWQQVEKRTQELYNNFNVHSFFSSPYALCTYAGIALSGYAWCYYTITKTRALLNNPEAWCNWKSEHSLEELFEYPRAELLKNLLTDIHTQYAHKNHITESTYALNIFLEQCTKELELCKRYFTLRTWIYRLYLNRFFPLYEKDLLLLKSKVERLAYIKTIFFSWAAEFKTTRCLQTSAKV